MRLITGAGGGGKDGGGSGRVAQEESDNLQSKSYAQVLDLVSEGEIEGLVYGLRSVFLDGTPLMAEDGTSNFSGVAVDFRPGTQHQGFIPGFASSEHEVSVGVEIKKDYPVIRTITNENVNAVWVRISVPQLTYQDPRTGDLRGSEVSFAVEVNTDGSGWIQKASDTFIGKTVSKYVRSYRVELPEGNAHQIRLRRLTADATGSNLQNKTYWDSYGEIVDVKLRYPNSAIVAISVDAENFKSIPTRAYDVKLLRVKVPSNYQPEKRIYSGIWDGTFQIAWTNNPAWVFYDLVTNERYGLGAHISESQVDKWTLYKIAQYCDELVEDGFGKLEPRFLCNAYFQTRAEAYNVIQDLASVFRSLAYWSGGMLTLSQDSPQDAVHLFTPSNVVGGDFQYQGTSRKDRYTAAMVSWNDPEDGFSQKIEYVEDPELILKFGFVQKEVVAFGCTSRGQAHRFGKWLIYSSQYETETVTFQTGIEAAVIRPGEQIKVQDPMRAGSRRSGRVAVALLDQVTLDQEVVLGDFENTLSVMLPDGTVEEKIVSHVIGRTVFLTSDLSLIPHKESVWMLATVEVEPQDFRVVSVAQDDGVYSITALSHNKSKFDFIEKDLKLENRRISSLAVVPESPQGLRVVETLYDANGEVRTKATFSWTAVDNAVTYISQYRPDNGNLVTIAQDRANEVEISNITPGSYDFYVVAVSALDKKSGKSSIRKTILGKAYPPANVQELSLIPMANQARLSWKRSTDLDVTIGGSIRIRHSPKVGAEWKDAIDLAYLPGNSTNAQVDLMNGTYFAKFVDSSGNSSIAPAIVSTSSLEASKLNVVMTLTEHPTFPGVRDGMDYDIALGGLAITAVMTIDDWLDPIDDAPSFDYLGGVAGSGEYAFATHADLTEVYTCNLLANIEAVAIDVADQFDMREDPIDSWLDFDGDNLDDVNVEIFVQSTDEDPTDPDAVWTDWRRFFVGQYKARAFRFKVKATSNSLNHNIIIKKLSVSIDMPDRTVNGSDILSDIAGSNIVFEKPFAEIPTIGITAHDLGKDERYKVEDKTVSGFKVTFFDGVGAPIARRFDYLAKGYGRRV